MKIEPMKKPPVPMKARQKAHKIVLFLSLRYHMEPYCNTAIVRFLSCLTHDMRIFRQHKKNVFRLF